MRNMNILLGLLLVVGVGCVRPAAEAPASGEAACTFTNPLGPGQDPYVAQHEGWYYLVESRDRGIYVYKSDDLTALRTNGVRVWSAPEDGWNRATVWAPELHRIDGRWYIYYAAGRGGPPFVHQRSGVLQSAGDDPQGAYRDRGMLHTGDGAENIWAIDLTVARLGEQLYAIWSGWEENRAADETPQQLYIAEMSNPWTIGSDRVQISAPTESWERGTALDLNEGPQVLKHAGEVFVIYSTRESWLKEYRLGQLRLESSEADPMDAENWIKTGPVFEGTEAVHGTGHASFVTSPDGREDWIVYHAKVDTTPGWNREIRAQPFGWTAEGHPDFGTPVPDGEPLPAPSGTCE